MSRRLVPWSSQEEWTQVYNNLYSSTPHLQTNAINRIKAWSSRGKVPHAIESTATLLEVSLQDSTSTSCSQKALAYLYAMALVRFVNGIVDGGQKGTLASSAVGIAEQIGLPIWFVEQRHQATHDRIPLLPYLRKSNSHALKWLDTHYWTVQATAVRDVAVEIAGAVDAYLDDVARGGTGVKSVGVVTAVVSIDTYPEVLVPVLVEAMGRGRKMDRSTLGRWDGMVEMCVALWPGFVAVLFEAVLDGVARQSQAKQSWGLCKYLVSSYSKGLTVDDVVGMLKLCFLQIHHPQALPLIKEIQRVATMPDKDHRYHAMIQYLIQKDALANGDPEIHESKAAELEAQLKALQERIESSKTHTTQDTFMTTDRPIPDTTDWCLSDEPFECPIGAMSGSTRVPDLELDACFDDLGWLNQNGMLFVPVLYDGVGEVDVIEREVGVVEKPEKKIKLF